MRRVACGVRLSVRLWLWRATVGCGAGGCAGCGDGAAVAEAAAK